MTTNRGEAHAEQCGCRISFAQLNAAGDLERVTIHYGKGRVAYVVLPTQSGVDLARELLDTLQATVKHFTKSPSTLADSRVRGTAHEVIAKAYEQIGYGGTAIAAAAQSAEEAPRLVGYGDCKCVLTQYCDGTCRPIFEKVAAARDDDPLWNHKGNVRHDAVDRLGERRRAESLRATATQSAQTTEQSCPRCELPLSQSCNCDAAYALRAGAQRTPTERALTTEQIDKIRDSFSGIEKVPSRATVQRVAMAVLAIAATRPASGGNHD